MAREEMRLTRGFPIALVLLVPENGCICMSIIYLELLMPSDLSSVGGISIDGAIQGNYYHTAFSWTGK
jgi:hypothetical protein